jgi:organic radical activating enzyme
MFSSLPKKFDYTVKKIFGKDIKIIQNCCNRLDMSCCGGGSSCCKSLFLHVNSYCNANCYFCITDKTYNEINDFVKLKKVIHELVNKEIVSKVVLTGGEPLLHPKFNRFIDILDKVNLRYYSLNTNGILLYKFIDKINESNLKHINISMHHHDDSINKIIMKNCLTYEQVRNIRNEIKSDIEIRIACTITEFLYTEKDIMAYIENARKNNINNVIFRSEYKGFDKRLHSFKKIWGDLFAADICNCGYKFIDGVNAEYRESNINLKQDICDSDLYYRDFIYKDDDMLSGSWKYNSQNIF